MLRKFSGLAVFIGLLFFICIIKNTTAQVVWQERDSEHFKVVYRELDSPLISHILQSAENALTPLMKLFDYVPAEKIVINTYDIYDYGFATATTVPHNYIRLEIEPLEQGYESVPYNDRFQWLLSHELVHIVINDKANNIESTGRTLFGKVAPEQIQPLTIPFSLLTNFNRYTPRWHQEAVAVFMETWLSGGFGRILGNFDEMYFRSMVADNKEFPSPEEIAILSTQNSFLLETIYYLYGARFTSYLSIKYGSDKLLEWFAAQSDEFYKGFKNKFSQIFKTDFNNAWEDFIAFEKDFQKKNISKVINQNAEITPVKRLTENPLGWVSSPHPDKKGSSIYFSYHQPHQLAGIGELNLRNNSFKEVNTLPTPSILQVSSTAYDKNLGLFFYTTNNNQLFRDIWSFSASTKERKLLFSNYRIGDLTVSPTTHDLWGIMHSSGKVSLVFSEYPYKQMKPMVIFNVGDEIFDLAVSPSGRFLSAILKRSNGDQSLILVDCDQLKNNQPFKFITLSSIGSPENPSWSPNEDFIYWNAYTNGVSNIYRIELKNNNIEPFSNIVTGLFKPAYLDDEYLFAFEFTSDGFIPVIIPNKPTEKLFAIEYLGQQVLDKNPGLTGYALEPSQQLKINLKEEDEYYSLNNLKFNTFIPVITGFQKEKVVGFFTHVSDPLVIHDLKMEFGISPFKNDPSKIDYHFKGEYEYKKILQLALNYNAPDFYDLFNERKRGMTGIQATLGYTHYYVYDNPLKIKQKTSISYYQGIESINDNLVEVSQPDFYIAQTEFNSENLRRSIGSSNFENGNRFNTTLLFFAADPRDPEIAGQFYTEWDNYSTYLWPHNVFHVKLGAGYHHKNENLRQAQFFFGGFGNREVENTDANQFRDLFRFPGLPIYSLPATRFLKLMFETMLPPLRFSYLNIGSHFLDHIDISLYNQNLLLESEQGKAFINLGGQINFIFKHWYNLESTFSGGIAQVWFGEEMSREWFLSFKLLKNF